MTVPVPVKNGDFGDLSTIIKRQAAELSGPLRSISSALESAEKVATNLLNHTPFVDVNPLTLAFPGGNVTQASSGRSGTLHERAKSSRDNLPPTDHRNASTPSPLESGKGPRSIGTKSDSVNQQSTGAPGSAVSRAGSTYRVRSREVNPPAESTGVERGRTAADKTAPVTLAIPLRKLVHEPTDTMRASNRDRDASTANHLHQRATEEPPALKNAGKLPADTENFVRMKDQALFPEPGSRSNVQSGQWVPAQQVSAANGPAASTSCMNVINSLVSAYEQVRQRSVSESDSPDVSTAGAGQSLFQKILRPADGNSPNRSPGNCSPSHGLDTPVRGVQDMRRSFMPAAMINASRDRTAEKSAAPGETSLNKEEDTPARLADTLAAELLRQARMQGVDPL